MSDTIAMPLEMLQKVNMDSGSGQPLCPACVRGHLHPYYVSILTGLVPGQGWQGVDHLTGFVAVCVGNRQHNRLIVEMYERIGEVWEPDPEVPACGFSMSLQAHRRPLP